MELILLEKIQNLGDLGDIVNVKSGYGRNYLIPQGKAMPASADAKEEVKARRRHWTLSVATRQKRRLRCFQSVSP